MDEALLSLALAPRSFSANSQFQDWNPDLNDLASTLDSSTHNHVLLTAPPTTKTTLSITTTTSTTQSSPFFLLPPELRTTIYSLLLTTPNPTTLTHLHPSLRPILLLRHLDIHPSLLLTCRLINGEATPVFYASNTFTAHPTLLTSLPHLLSPTRPIYTSSLIKMITRWFVQVRLDVDARFSAEDAEAAFSGAEELEVEAREAMYRSAGVDVLMLFQGVRGVRRARVSGSVRDGFARWLEGRMMCEVGAEVKEWEGQADGRGAQEEKYEVWGLGNR